ncbi:cation:proton antiporter [Protaetiibacter larvae]|uniref:Cation:proton antiporter n=1 Tax=Protaetiibacter larvae TaxID=2592654 RepID=A0A5C1Y7W6_9MICO|nr:cation:proton antiporter [Protaetiibacter larvae]QEO09295.1 cation:proton antiporter [Protaetiibacter larvae]
MHLGEELLVLGVLFLIAYALGRVGKLIGLPSIPIYMLVGLLASPHFHLFPLEFDSSYVALIAVFGLLFLLFNLGLEFDQDEFFGNAGKLLLSGGSYVLVNMGVGFGFGFAVGWGTREALVIAGMTATSSSAIVTKLLIELRRLANPETPMILGVTVVEDIFIAVYLAIVSVVISGETDFWAVVVKLVIAFAFLVVMFAVARWGGQVVSRLVQTKDDELFTILIFGLAVAFGGIGELLGVTDAIGAFLIGLALGATRFRARIEAFATPLRDVFGAFFFLSFGLALDPSTFGQVLVPVIVAILMTIVLNIAAGQFVAWLNGFGPQAGLNTAVILANRGEFALILATLATAGGLDARLTPFAGLYVLVMALVGPMLAVNSERIGRLFRRRRRVEEPHELDVQRARELALAEAAMAGEAVAVEPDVVREPVDASPIAALEDTVPDLESAREREVDPEY